ncbi:MFS transporter [Frondihabitans australicus]|uniref:Sugar phosphate permease n=1 Tax=Frondihabitans australicus TaxID=386892 RepID=A0A495IFI1_9MICO|nr:MFS transporter [Frondihabitans australicus]RKR74509.1 sugar phosphate permease [Frondihabitans australicus]
MSLLDEKPSRVAATPMRHRVRGNVVIILCVMYAISYIDRTNISTALPTIQANLHLTTDQTGLIVSAFSIPYALLQVFGGNLGERFGARKALFWIALLWGVATLATGLSIGFWTLFGARVLLGLTEAAAFPTATSAMTRWVPADRNGFVQGVVHSASRLGNAAAPLIVAWLIVWAGWRESFIVLGVVSVIWGVIWFVYFRNRPDEHKRVTEIELAEMPDRPKSEKRPPVPWRRMMRSIAPVAFVDFGYGWTLWVFLTWLPSFLGDSYGLKLLSYAGFTSVVLIGGVFGDTVGGVVSDAWFRRTGDMRKARRNTLMIGLIGSALWLIPVFAIHNLAVAIVSLTLSFFFLELCNATLWAIPMDTAPEWAGTASGMMNTGFGIAGIFSPIVFAALVSATGWQWPFFASIVLLVVSAVVAWRMNPKRITSRDGLVSNQKLA